MITEREVKILTHAIKEQTGLDIPPDAALTALYAVADYNYRLIPHKPEPRFSRHRASREAPARLLADPGPDGSLAFLRSVMEGHRAKRTLDTDS